MSPPTKAQVLAARARLALDRKLGRPSPGWIVELAGERLGPTYLKGVPWWKRVLHYAGWWP